MGVSKRPKAGLMLAAYSVVVGGLGGRFVGVTEPLLPVLAGGGGGSLVFKLGADIVHNLHSSSHKICAPATVAVGRKWNCSTPKHTETT